MNVVPKSTDTSRAGVQPQPVLPDAVAESGDWRQSLRQFHFTGRRPTAAEASATGAPLQPAVLGPWFELDRRWEEFPLHIATEPDPQTGAFAAPLLGLLRNAIGSLEPAGAELNVITDNLWRLVRLADGLAGNADRPFPDVFREACQSFAQEFDLTEASAKALQSQLEQLEAGLPKSGRLMRRTDAAVLDLYVQASRHHRRPLAKRLVTEIKSLLSRIEDQLHLDRLHSPEGVSPGALRASLGANVESRVNVDALSATLPPHRGSQRMDTARRQRLEEVTRIFKAHLTGAETAPEILLIHSDELPALPKGNLRKLVRRDSFEAALGSFSEEAGNLVQLIRALKIARLEADNQYDPEAHDEFFACMDWRALGPDELGLLTPIVVWANIETLQKFLGSYSEVLDSNRSIQVLIAHSDSASNAPNGIHAGLAYVSVAHREAFVLQSTLACPGHLADGLVRMVRACGPAVAFVGVPQKEKDSELGWLRAIAAHQGRVNPCFHYDPGAGSNWAGRFDVAENPQAEKPWPQYTIACHDSRGAQAPMVMSFTFAHGAALDPARRDQFLVIPTEAWSDEQVELADYLQKLVAGPTVAVPYIWVQNPKGQLQRAVVTRQLAFACLDRARYWRTLQELAGIDNEYARLAAEAARAKAGEEYEAAKKQLEAAHAAELEQIRAKAAGETIDRLVALLMNLDSMPAPQPAIIARAAAAARAAQAAAPAPGATPATAAPEKEEEVSFSDPYIDAPLCTTCNECTNLNPLLFKYNSNKQAYIADPKAGTFAQLVRAAEKCAPRIIHPGVPRPDDATATPELIAKAATFN